jgi:type II secretory pathway pseudopilin PulG
VIAIKHIWHWNQRGDTIVEVLIAMTVASSVLAISYATMNRNLVATRANQERGQASKLAQGQIESLRYAIAAGTSLPAPGSPFCLNGATVRSSGFSGGVPQADLNAEPLDTGYPNNCINNFYRYVIVEDAATPGIFHFYVRWDRVGGGRDQIIMVYKN